MEVTTTQQALSPETLEALVIGGDLSKLTQGQAVEYYRIFCQRLGLDPVTQPFKILNLGGKKVLYCDRGGASQLNKNHKVSHEITKREKDSDLYIVTAKASTPDGRQTESIGAVPIMNLKGEALANALMKAETKAKRRSTLDLLGLGMLDESETGSIPGAVQEMPPLIESKESEEESERKRFKHLRAELNKALQECKTDAEFKTACKAFQKVHGVQIWVMPTGHTDTETFRNLADIHSGRILEAAGADSRLKEVEKEWVIGINTCADKATFEGLEQTFGEYPILRDNATHLDELREKGRELGFTYAD